MNGGKSHYIHFNGQQDIRTAYTESPGKSNAIYFRNIYINSIMNIQIRSSKYSKKHFLNVNNNVVGTTIGT